MYGGRWCGRKWSELGGKRGAEGDWGGSGRVGSSLGGGSLSVVEVAGAAVGVVVRHADRGAVQVEVAAARAAGEAADGTTASGGTREEQQ